MILHILVRPHYVSHDFPTLPPQITRHRQALGPLYLKTDPFILKRTLPVKVVTSPKLKHNRDHSFHECLGNIRAICFLTTGYQGDEFNPEE